MRRALDGRVTWGAGRDTFFLTFMKARGFLAQNVTQEMVSFEGPLVNTDSEYSQYNTKVIVHGELKSNITGSVNFYYNRLDLAKLMWESHDGFGFPDVPGSLFYNQVSNIWNAYQGKSDWEAWRYDVLGFLADRTQLLHLDTVKRTGKVRYTVSANNPYFINSRGEETIDLVFQLPAWYDNNQEKNLRLYPTDKLEVRR